jgi:hypothetical protein
MGACRIAQSMTCCGAEEGPGRCAFTVRSGDHLHEESLLRLVTAVLMIWVFSGSARHNTFGVQSQR